MIIRNSCFETNSSSTHALCIGRGVKLRTPLELINEYKTGNSDYDDYERCSLLDNSVDNMNREFLPIIDMKSFNKYLDKALSVDQDKDMYLILSRYQNIGRVYKKYTSFPEKLNFIWTCLIHYYKDKDSDWFKTYYKDINLGLMVDKFFRYLDNAGFKLFCSDINFVNKDTKIKDSEYNEPINLGVLEAIGSCPKEWYNKKMIGIETYGYFPIKELDKTIQDPTLFWNLLLGESIIYTGSDETESFDDLDFSRYIVAFVGGSDYGSCLERDYFKYKLPDLIGEYINGNVQTKIYSDGTRTRELYPQEIYYENGLFKKDLFNKSELDLMEPEFPESIDLKITNYCNNNCKYCYAKSNKKGKHGDVIFIKEIIRKMKPYTEVAIGGR